MASDDEMETPTWKGIPGSIIYINIRDPGKLETAEVAHAATCRLMRQYLRTSSSQYISVCLFGVENSNTSIFGIKSVQEVFPLNLPTLDAFKTLQKVNLSSLNQSKDLILSDVLWHSRKMFANCKKQLLSRNVLILSRFDTPPMQADQKPAFKEAVDLCNSNIEVKLINISQTDYEIDQFYKDFLINANNKEEVDLPSPIWDHKDIEKLMHQQCNRHLAVARLSFEVGDGLEIGVGVYMLKGKIQQKTTPVDSVTHEILTPVNKTLKVRIEGDDMNMDGDNQPKTMPLLKSEILYYQTYGGERVEFTDNEMKMMRNPYGPPKLKLLGFKPAHILCKEKLIFKSCYFLFPNEGIIEGSTVAFKALHQACTEMKMVAICVLCTRVNARPKIVALSPCTKPLGLNVEVGFDIISIPFIENMRNLLTVEDNEDIIIEETNKSVMKDILNELKFDYKSETFENPKMQSLYRALEAIALEDDEIETFVDTTKPNPNKFDNINDDLFYEVFGPFEVSAAKRTAKSTTNEPKPKKVKSDCVDLVLLQDRISSKAVNKYTVAELKDILRSKNDNSLPALTGLKKNELVDLVYKNL